MPLYSVTITASCVAARAPDDTGERLRAWAAAGDGRTFIVDDSIAPVRWTATVEYQIDAGGEVAADLTRPLPAPQTLPAVGVEMKIAILGTGWSSVRWRLRWPSSATPS
jgi:hypothetical protein